MENNNLIWLLFAKQLAGEATWEEIQQLQSLKVENPEIDECFDEMIALWLLG